MSDPLISVVIPAYNASKVLGHCLQSLFASSHPGFECIVVDDHSDDDTFRVAESFRTRALRLDRRAGASHARNVGAEAAKGKLLLFLDADVSAYPDCLDRVARAFEEHPEISALFGSYDDEPGEPGFCSQYKNLFHHYVHQSSQEDASTFWSGCGAVKRDAFFKTGGFDEDCRMMEDVDLGYRLRAEGYRIRLVKDLLVKHLKRYSLWDLVRSDLFDRAIPWTILMLKNRELTSDLNLKARHKISALLVISAVVCVTMAFISSRFLLAAAVMLSLYLAMNYEFYTFFLKRRGRLFALKVVPLHILYYLYSTAGFLIGTLVYLLDRCGRRTRHPVASKKNCVHQQRAREERRPNSQTT